MRKEAEITRWTDTLFAVFCCRLVTFLAALQAQSIVELCKNIGSNVYVTWELWWSKSHCLHEKQAKRGPTHYNIAPQQYQLPKTSLTTCKVSKKCFFGRTTSKSLVLALMLNIVRTSVHDYKSHPHPAGAVITHLLKAHLNWHAYFLHWKLVAGLQLELHNILFEQCHHDVRVRSSHNAGPAMQMNSSHLIAGLNKNRNVSFFQYRAALVAISFSFKAEKYINELHTHPLAITFQQPIFFRVDNACAWADLSTEQWLNQTTFHPSPLPSPSATGWLCSGEQTVNTVYRVICCGTVCAEILKTPDK